MLQEFQSKTAPGYTDQYNFLFDSSNSANITIELFDETSPEVEIYFNFETQELEVKGIDNTTVNSGDGEKLLILFKKEGAPDNYGQSFRVSPNEKYLIFEKNYLGKADCALVIKNLKTDEDVFVFSSDSIFRQYPDIAGNFNMRDWTRDGKYFWGDIFDGADVLAFFRIDSADWKWEIFEVPGGTMGGTALNSEFGYITYDDGPPWTGDIEFSQMYKEQWLKDGKKVNFYLYNLFTKRQIILETVNDPLWNFKPIWLSDNELRYHLPSGEIKIYEIKL